MKEWLARLDVRERRLVLAAAIVLFIGLVYLLLWAPFSHRSEALEQNVAEQRELLAWMRQTAAEIQQLRPASGTGTLPPGQSLLAVVDQSATQNQLKSVIKRMEPTGQDTVRVWVEVAEFDALARWFVDLKTRYGISIDTVSMERHASPGRVDARITFKGVAA